MKKVWLVTLLTIASVCMAQDQELIDIMKSELDREFTLLSKQKDPVYFLSYRITDANRVIVSSSNGGLLMANADRSRSGRVDLRIGNYKKDNTQAESGEFQFRDFSAPLIFSNQNDALHIKSTLWKATKHAYETAKNEYDRLAFIEEEQKYEAFSKVDPQIDKSEIVHSTDVDVQYWSGLTKSLSLLFVENEAIVSSNVSFNFSDELEYFVSSEGSQISERQTYANIVISANIKAEDDVIPYYRTYFAFLPEDLPQKDILINEVQEIIETLNALKSAPRAEPYSGPAILSPEVAGVFFHEIFGHRIEGHRLRSDTDGQTFKEKIGKKVLADFLSVVSDPTLDQYDGMPLSGTYSFDDEGVKPSRVEIVKNGYLKTFLMSRQPLGTLNKSNGHGRGDIGATPVARQSNLIIESSKGMRDEDLRRALIAACKEQGKTYGYYFKEVTGGYTQTNRYSINAFNIDPILVYKIYVDGRPDEMVRGVNLIGTPLAMFSQIRASGIVSKTFNGYCGAESGFIPVSATAPALFVERIETQKKPTNSSIEDAILSNPILEKFEKGGKDE